MFSKPGEKEYMARWEFAGKAQTVLGLVEGEKLGITLPHEHLIIDLVKAQFIEPSNDKEQEMAYKPVGIETLHWLRYHLVESVDNLRLTDEQEAIDEVMLFKKAGGATIVDVTNVGLGRDPEALVRISRVTGLNIIMGAGYYMGTSHPADLSAKAEEEIVEEIVRDINVGVGNSGICAGIIGEIGTSWPLEDNEKKVLRAAANAQQLTGAPINIHPGRKNNVVALKAVEVLHNAGADLSRTVVSHVDVRVRDHNVRCQIAKAGCYLEYDHTGWEGPTPLSLYQDSDIDIPNDTQRIYEIMQLIEEGYLNKILISHDICMKTRRACYGGWGYAHISNYIVPKMLEKGMTSQQINTIMIENPKRMLCFV
jgi:phosphotriesterase-related protein